MSEEVICRESDCCNEPTDYHSDQEGFDEAQNCRVVQILTTSLPNATIGAAYSESLSAFGGTPPYIWTYVSGLPDGLSLSALGIISGTPTESGSFEVVAKVTDADGNACSNTISLSVYPSVIDVAAYWPFDLPDQLVDVTGSGNDLGIFSGSVSPEAGIIKECGLQANGTLLSVISASLAFALTDGFTVAGWFKRTTIASTNSNIVFQLDQALSTFQFVDNQVTIFDPEPEQFRWFQIAGTGFTTPNNEFHNVTPSHGVWLFFAAWLDPADNTMHYRINDTVFATSGVAVPEPAGTARITIQTTQALRLDEMGYWRRKLTTVELDFLRTGVTWPFV